MGTGPSDRWHCLPISRSRVWSNYLRQRGPRWGGTRRLRARCSPPTSTHAFLSTVALVMRSAPTAWALRAPTWWTGCREGSRCRSRRAGLSKGEFDRGHRQPGAKRTPLGLPASSTLGPRSSFNPQMSRLRRTKGGVDRTVNDPDRRREQLGLDHSPDRRRAHEPELAQVDDAPGGLGPSAKRGAAPTKPGSSVRTCGGEVPLAVG